MASSQHARVALQVHANNSLQKRVSTEPHEPVCGRVIVVQLNTNLSIQNMDMMASLAGFWSRITDWEITPPDSFTYRSYLRFLIKALPIYGLGPGVIIVYHFIAYGVIQALVFVCWAGAAVAMSVVGFALARRDLTYSVVAAVPALLGYMLIYDWSTATEIGSWVMLFAGWFGAIAMLIGTVAAHR